MTALTRGPLPARVYWTRRVLLLVVVTGLVVGLVQLVALAMGGGTPTPPDQAAPVAAEPSTDVTEVPDVSEPSPSTEPESTKRDKRDRGDAEPVLADPEGPCVDRDVAVTPTAKKTVGGSPVTFTLELRTVQSVACTWEVSPRTVTVKVTSGDDGIWYSQQCPRSVPTEEVVLRNDVTTEVEVTWSGRRSDEECDPRTDWALPGWYHVEAAALAGEPSDLQFQLTAPEPEVVTETVRPDPKQGEKDDKTDREEQPRDDQGGRDRG